MKTQADEDEYKVQETMPVQSGKRRKPTLYHIPAALVQFLRMAVFSLKDAKRRTRTTLQ